MLSNTLRLNFFYLKIIHILHPRYHPITAHILKNRLMNKCVCFHEIIRLVIMKMEMKMKNRSHRYDINRLYGLDMDTNIVNIKSVSVWWRLYVLSNTYATLEVQFMKKVSNTVAELKESVAYEIKSVFVILCEIWQNYKKLVFFNVIVSDVFFPCLFFI